MLKILKSFFSFKDLGITDRILSLKERKGKYIVSKPDSRKRTIVSICNNIQVYIIQLNICNKCLKDNLIIGTIPSITDIKEVSLRDFFLSDGYYIDETKSIIEFKEASLEFVRLYNELLDSKSNTGIKGRNTYLLFHFYKNLEDVVILLSEELQ